MSNESAIALLDKWLQDESGYDEETWKEIKQNVTQIPMEEKIMNCKNCKHLDLIGPVNVLGYCNAYEKDIEHNNIPIGCEKFDQETNDLKGQFVVQGE